MSYVRKTKDVYALMWYSQYGIEEIDSFDTYKEAKEMKKEYELAYHGSGSILIEMRREKIA